MKFFAPFGPKFLQLQLQDDIRIKLLDCVNQLRQSPSETKGKWSILSLEREGLYASQKNSIVDGEMVLITPSDLEKHENIIADIITDLIKLYAQNFYEDQEVEIEQYEYLLTDCWYVVMKSGDFHMLHNHKKKEDILSIGQLSGAIYLDIPENLPFPQGAIEWVLSGETNNLSGSSCEVSPQTGDVFIWPSWLRHHVYPFRSNKERIMISFNGFWDVSMETMQQDQ